MWIEKFIATLQRHSLLVADAERNRNRQLAARQAGYALAMLLYDLREPAVEVAFQKLQGK
jgi:hypothetical protein